MARKRKIPLRKCIVTNEMKEKQQLIRVVRNKEGEIFIDKTGKQNGRGAYLSMDLDVIEKAQKTKALDTVFKKTVDNDIYEQLKTIVSGKSNVQ